MSGPKFINAEQFVAKYGDWYTEEGTEIGFIGTIKYLVEQMPAVDIPQWIPVKTRPMTSDERSEWEEMAGIKLEDEEAVFFDCPMPYDGQEVLVCSKYGHVSMDECVCDEYGVSLDVNGDWDGIVAWMPLPNPYKGGEQNG